MTTLTYQCAPHTKWAVETHRIILFNEKTGIVSIISYPQAAIWDFISRGYSYAHIVCLMCAITSRHHDDVKTLILKYLESWAKAGFLLTNQDDG